MKKNNKRHISPLRYPGGKNCIFPFMSDFLKENGLIGAGYAEPYAGGAGLALRLLSEGLVKHIYINDLDTSIYSFWHTILNYSDDFCEWINEVDVTIENWRKYKEIQNNYHLFNTMEVAKSTFFLNRTNISGVIKGGPIGGSGQNGKYKINARFNKADLIERIQNIAKMKSRISISNYDGVEFIKRINRRRKDIFIYLDPPYVKKGSGLYMNYFTLKDHKRLCSYVKRLKKRWMVSYDNNEFIVNLYSSKLKLSYQLSQCASNRVGNEILIFSDNLNYEHSITYLKSPTIIQTNSIGLSI